ncbi:MAG TPA: hypothetical protein VMT03_05170 [Polyangia bacterium]|nr:hypothetical protein [Polyangia bacterium]
MLGAGARVAVVLAASAVALSAAGCRHKSKTPDEAYQRFADAVKKGDGAALFDALDQATRWDLMTTQKAHREAYDIVLSNYPEGPEREREKRRYEPAATASSARELFRTATAPGLLPMMQAQVTGTVHFERGASDGQADAITEGGARLPFAIGQDGGWGYAGLAKQVADDKNRAYHDLDVVRASAADYERAAARAAK